MKELSLAGHEDEMQFNLDFAYAYGKPQHTGILKRTNADFIVQEILPENFSDDGEHHYVLVEKDGENSHWITRKLADFCGVEVSSVGFAGLKDRNAVTQQWFSVQLPGQSEVNWQGFDQPSFRILKSARHSKKLRRGDHLGNRFVITIHGLEPAASADLESRLRLVVQNGVPNYFGEQRFGIGAENLIQAHHWFDGGKKIKNRKQKGFVLSAARSYLFNQLLSQRVAAGNWREVIAGDVIEGDAVEAQGVPSGPLWGRGRLASAEQALQYEQSIEQSYPSWCNSLEHQGLSQERRPLVLQPANLSWQWQDTALVLSFQLPPGQFATSLVRELCLC